MRRALDWLPRGRSWTWSATGRWPGRRLRPGGWAFEYRNDHYPDVDDTAVVVCALHRADPERYRDAIARGTEWVMGMQSRNGGWGSFDADNTHYYLNHIPFADHGALLDPPTADLTARCISMLAQQGYDRSHPAMAAGARLSRREQEADGSWFGRWGTNYIYGTWSALVALNAAGEDMDAAQCGARSTGSRRASRRTAAGARAAPATGPSARPSRSRARPRRPPGRCSA